MTVSNIELIWEGQSAIAVNKPAGLSTQAPQDIESLESRLKEEIGGTQQYIAFPHRLDRVVSGVILVARTKKAARLLSAQFASRKTRKRYLAVVEGHFDSRTIGQSEKKEASMPVEVTGNPGNRLKDRMEDCQDGFLRWQNYVRKVEGQSLAEECRASDPGAKLAVTDVRTLQLDSDPNRSRLELLPITGRMHQLRLQCALRGHPIVGDHTYGAAKKHTLSRELKYGNTAGLAADVTEVERDSNPSGGENPANHSPGEDRPRIMLHAQSLGFHDPSTGRWTEVEAQCPF